ncbi:MAG: MASE3 domain-containing protein [Desulfuromonadaceae bacterium]|nr:MASE3 domain-containing protein [Desulfuromonadaceae bacterium]
MDIAEYTVVNNKAMNWFLVCILMTGLFLTKKINYLLFHSIVELFSIIVACTVYIVAWKSAPYIKNSYLTTVGISYLFIGILDLLHTLSYKGMPIFVDYDFYANQLWIAARYLESITLLAAFILLLEGKKVRAEFLFAGYSIITALLIVSIFYWKIFPVCFVAGQGLTGFKIYSEYAICLILCLSLIMLIKNRKLFAEPIYKLLLLSAICTIISELAFTLYLDNYGISNVVGHYFKLFSFMMIYKAVVATGIEEPYQLIFKELKQANITLQDEIDLRIKTEVERESVIKSLTTALEEIKVLEGILPICMHCKKVRDDSGYWNQLETYIRARSGVDFSHGVCPDCVKEHYPWYQRPQN